jgi:hypothetical protein
LQAFLKIAEILITERLRDCLCLLRHYWDYPSGEAIIILAPGICAHLSETGYMAFAHAHPINIPLQKVILAVSWPINLIVVSTSNFQYPPSLPSCRMKTSRYFKV